VTLILVAADRTGIHHSCDYRLSRIDNGKAQIPDDAGAKTFEVVGGTNVALISYTGLAEVNGVKTRNWIAQIIQQAGEAPDIQEIAGKIAKRGTQTVQAAFKSPEVPERLRTLTVVVATRRHPSTLQLIIASNIVALGDSPPRAPLDHLMLSTRDITKPLVLAFDPGGTIHRHDRQLIVRRLEARAAPSEICESLANLNRSAGARSSGFISPECMVSSLFANGTLQRTNVGEVSGIPEIVIGGQSLGDWVRQHFAAVPGKQISLVQSTSQIARSIPARKVGRARRVSTRKNLGGTKTVAARKVGRNEPCPCGSGKKYKKCCGR